MSYLLYRKAFLTFFLFLAPSLLQASTIDRSFELFVQYEQAELLDDEDSMKAIFDACNIPLKESSGALVRPLIKKIKAVRLELKSLKRKSKKKSTDYQDKADLLKSLKRFRRHIKYHRHIYNFLGFSQTIQRRYNNAFGNIHIVEDVYKQQDLFTYSKKKGDPLVKFYKQLIADLATISLFEDRLHSRYAKLKALNYSFKIEGIKVRNEIIFHPWYKHRHRSGHEFFRDAMGPLSYMGVVLFHVVPSVFCIIGLTLSTSLGGSGNNQD